MSILPGVSDLFSDAAKGRLEDAAPLATRLRPRRLEDFVGQWAIVQNTLEVVDDPQTIANGYVLESATADGTAYKTVTTPVQFDGEPSPPKRAPEFNEHGDAILADLGLDWDTVVDLKVRGIVA